MLIGHRQNCTHGASGLIVCCVPGRIGGWYSAHPTVPCLYSQEQTSHLVVALQLQDFWRSESKSLGILLHGQDNYWILHSCLRACMIESRNTIDIGSGLLDDGIKQQMSQTREGQTDNWRNLWDHCRSSSSTSATPRYRARVALTGQSVWWKSGRWSASKLSLTVRGALTNRSACSCCDEKILEGAGSTQQEELNLRVLARGSVDARHMSVAVRSMDTTRQMLSATRPSTLDKGWWKSVDHRRSKLD